MFVGPGPPRQQPWLLEDEADPRVRAGDGLPSSVDRAARRGEEAGDDAQQRRLAAAVRSDERDDPRRPAMSRSTPSRATSDPALRAARERDRPRRPGGGPRSPRHPVGEAAQDRRGRRVQVDVRLEEPVVRRRRARPAARCGGRSGSSPRWRPRRRDARRSRPRRGSPSRAPRSRARPGTATGKPVTSALMAFQASLRAGPPQARISVHADAGGEHRTSRRGGWPAPTPRGSPARGGRGRGPGSGRRTRRARRRVPERRALAGQVREEDQAVGAGRRRGRLARGAPRSSTVAAEDRVAIPVERRPVAAIAAPTLYRPASGAGVTNAPGTSTGSSQ